MVMASALVVAMAVMMWEGGDGPDLGNGDGECAGGDTGSGGDNVRW